MANAKMKTHKGAKKRFKVSANGKVLFAKKGRRHLMSSKNAKRCRRLRAAGVSEGTDAANIKKQLPYA
jgi:large subunit ribosomal protein L35